MPSVAFHTLGCKLNYSESSMLQKQLEQEGFEVLGFNQKADIYVINTCSVTEFADKKCRNIVGQAKKRNGDADVVMIGCYAQLKPENIAEIPGVSMVLGAAEKFRLVENIKQLGQTDNVVVKAGDITEVTDYEAAFSSGDRTRSFLKVQDGCDYKCTFCTIPLARGRSRSDSIENIVTKAQILAQQGVKEIVLTGVNIGDYGNGSMLTPSQKSSKEVRFIDLIRALDEVDGIRRFRISSIEPNLCSDEIIDFVAGSKRFVPHLHMPLQSGSDRILRSMKRRYNRGLYRNRVQRIKQRMPNACIGVDVIVGYPGESDDDFMETFEFLKDLDVSYFHVFTYSKRINTPAWDMSNHVAHAKKKKRNEILRGLSNDKKQSFYASQIGKEVEVLLEPSKDLDMLSGFSENYIKVQLPNNKLEPGSLISLELTSNILSLQN